MRKKSFLSYEAKVILGFFIFLAVVLSPFYMQEQLQNLKDLIQNLYTKYLAQYPVYIEVLIVLSPIILFVLYKLIAKNRSSYTQDTFYNIDWTWKWRGKEVTNLQCFCPTCKGELFYDDTTSNYILNVSKIDFICDNCQKVVGSIHNENRKMRSQMNVKNELQRIINRTLDKH